MIRNPYNITLKSTKRNIITIVVVILLLVAGFVLMNNHGFGYQTNLSMSKAAGTDEFIVESVLYIVNFAFALLTAVVAVMIIIFRRDLLGVISGIILFAFILFVFAIGSKNTSGGIAGVNKKENITLPTMLIEKITQK